MKTRTIRFEAIGPKGRRVKMHIVEGGHTIILREHRLRRAVRIKAQRLVDIAFNDAEIQPNLFVDLRAGAHLET